VSDFRDAATEDIYNGDDTKAARRLLPTWLHETARRKMTVIRRASNIDDLGDPPSNHLEALTGDRPGSLASESTGDTVFALHGTMTRRLISK
jgi:toxin HigB-1